MDFSTLQETHESQVKQYLPLDLALNDRLGYSAHGRGPSC
jgi:hypothetical protein